MELGEALNAINSSKKNIIRESDAPDASEKLYPRFIISKLLAQHIDAVFQVNDLNIRGLSSYGITNRQHFEYLLNSVPRKKRFGKLPKAEPEEKLKTIAAFYKYSIREARMVEHLITDEQLLMMNKRLDPGGARK